MNTTSVSGRLLVNASEDASAEFVCLLHGGIGIQHRTVVKGAATSQERAAMHMLGRKDGLQHVADQLGGTSLYQVPCLGWTVDVVRSGFLRLAKGGSMVFIPEEAAIVPDLAWVRECSTLLSHRYSGDAVSEIEALLRSEEDLAELDSIYYLTEDMQELL